jgi:hypothetical protein
MINSTDDRCHVQQAQLGQFFTPIWACELLYEKYFRHFTASDHVLEPSAGTGNMLTVIPNDIPAYGIEIDPVLAKQAELVSGRTILIGDFRTIELPAQPTVILGNPPFQSHLLESFIDRAHTILPPDGVLGFILPACFLQTTHRTMRIAKQWSIAIDILPRELFRRIRFSLVFALFRKGVPRRLIGFSLFRETAAWKAFPQSVRRTLNGNGTGVWAAAVHEALTELGGQATLRALYYFLARKRPTNNRWWEAKIRQTLRAYPQHFDRLKPGLYAIRPQAPNYAIVEESLYHAQPNI